MPRTFRLFPAVAFLLILCLAPRAGAAAEPARFPASFVAAGLLLKPDETPEETLLRAHGRDARAMTLVAVGYALGVGGFPQEYALGAQWAHQAYTHGATAFVLSPLLQQEAARLRGGTPSPMELGEMVSGCMMGHEDPTATLLREAGIFDLEAFCARVEVWKVDLPGWETYLPEYLERSRSLHKRIREFIHLARALRSRPATVEEREARLGGIISMETWLFFAATSHDPATQAPDWSADRLLAFLEAQLPDPKSGEVAPDRFLAHMAEEALANGLGQNPGDAAMALDLIRRAHAGDTEAMRVMALRYRDGGLGFLQEGPMNLCWLEHAALEFGDAESMLLLAVAFVPYGSSDEAWAWASLVDTARNPDERIKRLTERLSKVIEARYGTEVVADGQKRALFYREQRKAREDLRKEAEQNRSAAPVSDKK